MCSDGRLGANFDVWGGDMFHVMCKSSKLIRNVPIRLRGWPIILANSSWILLVLCIIKWKTERSIVYIKECGKDFARLTVFRGSYRGCSPAKYNNIVESLIVFKGLQVVVYEFKPKFDRFCTLCAHQSAETSTGGSIFWGLNILLVKYRSGLEYMRLSTLSAKKIRWLWIYILWLCFERHVNGFAFLWKIEMLWSRVGLVVVE
jgi:hypothetical protein